MTRAQLLEQIHARHSYLCVGLDTDRSKLPSHLRDRKDGVIEFNKAIIDATKDYCVSYKINTAFYEAEGLRGWEAMQETVNYIPDTHFRIADAKRGDIGNTSTQYARAFFEAMNFDAVTVAPYMGEDSVRPFLDYPGKWTILLGLTSNPGAYDFELQQVVRERGPESTDDSFARLYEVVLEKAARWGSPDQLMFVIGATRADEFTNIRRLTPEHFYLVPGVGAQGGSLEEISRKAMTRDCGLLVNASRAVIFASPGEDFAEAAGAAAKAYADEMKGYLSF